MSGTKEERALKEIGVDMKYRENIKMLHSGKLFQMYATKN